MLNVGEGHSRNCHLRIHAAWEPGRYTILDYAKNVQDFRAVSGRSQPLKWEQTDKQTWRISKAAADDVTVRYQVFSRC